MTDVYTDTAGLPGRDAVFAKVPIGMREEAVEHFNRLNKEHDTQISLSEMGQIVAATEKDILIMRRDIVEHPEFYK